MIKAIIVEDSRLARLELASLLASIGDVELVGEAENVDQAIALVERTSPDLILLDINMPGMNGFDVLSFLRSRKEGRCLPIVMLTTSSSKEDITKAYELGANAYMVKPASLDGMKSLARTFEAFWVSTAEVAQ